MPLKIYRLTHIKSQKQEFTMAALILYPISTKIKKIDKLHLHVVNAVYCPIFSSDYIGSKQVDVSLVIEHNEKIM